jgi:hypothetical protein
MPVRVRTQNPDPANHRLLDGPTNLSAKIETQRRPASDGQAEQPKPAFALARHALPDLDSGVVD